MVLKELCKVIDIERLLLLEYCNYGSRRGENVDRNFNIFIMIELRGLKLGEVAKIMSLTRERVRQINSRVKRNLSHAWVGYESFSLVGLLEDMAARHMGLDHNKLEMISLGE